MLTGIRIAQYEPCLRIVAEMLKVRYNTRSGIITLNAGDRAQMCTRDGRIVRLSCDCICKNFIHLNITPVFTIVFADIQSIIERVPVMFAIYDAFCINSIAY